MILFTISIGTGSWMRWNPLSNSVENRSRKMPFETSGRLVILPQHLHTTHFAMIWTKISMMNSMTTIWRMILSGKESLSNFRELQYVLRVPLWAPSILMVGQVGIEPTVYLTSRFYRPLQSPAMRTDPYGWGGWI